MFQTIEATARYGWVYHSATGKVVSGELEVLYIDLQGLDASIQSSVKAKLNGEDFEKNRLVVIPLPDLRMS